MKNAALEKRYQVSKSKAQSMPWVSSSQWKKTLQYQGERERFEYRDLSSVCLLFVVVVFVAVIAEERKKIASS